LGYRTKLLLLFGLYFVTARIGLSLGAVSGFATLVWPPSGIALAALLILGRRYWPAIALGAFTVNLVVGASVPVALGIALGNTLECLLGVYLLKRFTKIHISLERVRDVLGLILYAALLATLVSATIGTTSILFGGVITAGAYGETWVAWWVGDMLGVLVVAPILLVWSERLHTTVSLRRLLSASVPIAILIIVSVVVFRGFLWFGIRPFAFAYVVFPLLVWIVLRFDQRGSVTATFIVSLIAVWGTITTHSSAAKGTLGQSLLLLQSFIGITAATFMTMAAVVSEREQTQRHEQRLTQKTAALTRQRARLEALNQAKDEFISIASHQLRTPATGVKQYLGMVLEAYAGKVNKQQQNYLETAYDSNERQLKIINDLLRVARLDAGKLRPEKTNCNLTRLVADVVKQESKKFERYRQKLAYKPSKRTIYAHIDKGLMRMVLENIIDNAGKYSAEHAEVSIAVEQTSTHVRLHITDRGIGIAKKDQKKLFQKFSRIENPQSSFVNGSGLGLYWAQKVVDLHGGTIGLVSKPGEGSTFTVSLPKRQK
jgi:signal transduction histidine kinase